MENKALTIKYRPKIYSDVIGQPVAVEFLSGLSRMQVRRHILLYGSIGSGKTTLARIYAKSLHCLALQKDGSPCLTCSGCNSIDNDPLKFVELDAPSFDDEDEFRTQLKYYQNPRPAPGNTRIIFIDEAHSLRKFRGAMDILLKELEGDASSITYILATTQPEAISRAVKSRTAELRVQPLSSDLGRSLLRNVLDKEKALDKEKVIDVEDEALTLIWGLGGGQPRNMIQALDVVLSIGPVTRDAVRDIFDVADTDFLLKYLVELGRGDFEAQSKLLFEWPAAVHRKVSLIQGALISIYYNDLMACTMMVNPAIASIKPEERAPVLEAFSTRFEDPSRLRRAWLEMLGLLPAAPEEMSDEGLWSVVALFQERVSRSELGAGQSFKDELPSEHRAVTRRPLKLDKVERDPRYLSVAEIHKIYNSASAFTQAYGRQFNVMITVRHDRFGCSDQKQAGSNTGAFSNQLGQRLKTWYGYNDRMLVQEFDAALGRCARIVASLPDLRQETIANLRRWIAYWRLDKRVDQVNGDAITFEVAQEVTGMNAHWECVRWLCGGAKPDEAIKDLKLTYRVAGDIGSGNRFASSDSCGENLSTGGGGLPFLSAFDAKKWSELYSGWELDAYQIRLRMADTSPEKGSANLDSCRAQLADLQGRRGLTGGA